MNTPEENVEYFNMIARGNGKAELWYQITREQADKMTADYKSRGFDVKEYPFDPDIEKLYAHLYEV